MDQPTAKLLNFVNKHYGLSDYVPQANHAVVFNEFFSLPDTSKGYRAAQERRRPDSAQRSRKQASQKRRSLEPARIVNSDQLKRNVRVPARHQPQQRNEHSPPWPTVAGLLRNPRRG